jgi:cytoskeletal protein CcmA (bactofilin family)
MWPERKQDNSIPRKQPSFGNQPVVNQPEPAAFRPVASTSHVAVIGKGMLIKGEIHSSEDLYIDGQVQGKLLLQDCKLTIGPNGRADCGAKAREVEILGRIDGNVETTEKIAIRKGGELVGDVRTAGIVIEDGAYFKGSIDIVKHKEAPKEVPKEAPKPVEKEQQAAMIA